MLHCLFEVGLESLTDVCISHYLPHEPPQPPGCFPVPPHGLVAAELPVHPLPPHSPALAQSPAESLVPVHSLSHWPSRCPLPEPPPLQSPVQSSHDAVETGEAAYVALADVSGMTSSGVLVAATMPVPSISTGSTMAREMVNFLFRVIHPSEAVAMAATVSDECEGSVKTLMRWGEGG